MDIKDMTEEQIFKRRAEYDVVANLSDVQK